MRFQPDQWTDHCDSWMPSFIHDHYLMIGSMAWQGYQQAGRGLVFCEIYPSQGRSSSFWPYHLRFTPQRHMPSRLQRLALEDDTIDQVERSLTTYDPHQAMVLLLVAGDQIEIDLLQNVAIAPEICHAQIRQRWSEFQPCFTHPWLDQP